ncbi:hypothetical protein [Mucilaginibacter rubeus]|uniref:Uncharacterized protein n=1 Tax=Mucilaginibacter rubeus TaxID=2027860 RepID=A0A5C1I870_9SPHI|nr:hypothetical protein [Mucilaginibacter rubeus]QEM13570.1 hypothetical protein DEO27_027350 [Mucilaginibacter rubeus]
MDDNLFLVPREVAGDKYGFEFFANLAGSTLLLRNQEIVIDFESCNFFEGNLCSILGNILDSCIERGNRISIKNLIGNVRGAISRNGFLQNFASSISSPNLFQTSVPYRRFKMEDESIAKDFFKVELFEKQKMPKMSPLAQKEIIRNIFEVCLNAVTHGECEYIYCCGQVYLRKNTPKAVLTFTDLGKTIKANVNNYLAENKSGIDAIRWALTDGNTTKTAAIPGGLGLKLLQDLIHLNKGTLQFISADGFVEVCEGKVNSSSLEIDFPGTIVTIELLLKDPNFYILNTEKNDWDDFF